jgi:hypothetical protein
MLTSGELDNVQSSGQQYNNEFMEVVNMLQDIKQDTVKLRKFSNVLTPKELQTPYIEVEEHNNELERNLGDGEAPELPKTKASTPYKMSNDTCSNKACLMYESVLVNKNIIFIY